MLYPRLKLRTQTVAGAADAQAAATGDKKEVKPADVKAEIGEDPDPCSSMPGQAVVVEVEVTREHVGGTASASVSGGPMNPHGILEAYWLYVEGLKPDGTPNSLLGAQPMVVTDLALPVLKGKVSFMAPCRRQSTRRRPPLRRPSCPPWGACAGLPSPLPSTPHLPFACFFCHRQADAGRVQARRARGQHERRRHRHAFGVCLHRTGGRRAAAAVSAAR